MIAINERDLIYGADYNYYAGGGAPRRKLCKVGSNREIFYHERDMVKRVLELREDYLIGDIEMYTTKIVKEAYEFKPNK